MGPPHKDHGVTIYHREFVSQLDKEAVKESLQGQVLYVVEKDIQEARWLIDEFQLDGGQSYGHGAWRQMCREGAGRKMSLTTAGVDHQAAHR